MIAETESAQSNLERFLDRTTPVVQSQLLPKSEIRNLNKLWNPWGRENVEFFRLSDLWKRYDEWSAYGAGVPIVLDTGETLIQYYVPYLSAIQIFISNTTRREDVEWVSETRGGSLSDSFSEDSESEKVSTRWDGCSSEEENGSILHLNDRLGSLYFQLFDISTPYSRVPLKDKICGLAERYPGLMNLRSVDLSPASWMAVAWYPIYHIPMGRTIKDLSTCFLTYHTLSSSFQDRDDDDEDDDELGSGMKRKMMMMKKKRKEGEGERERHEVEEEEGVRLSPFGLATYKMKGDVWATGRDQERLFSLVSVADSWLKQLRVQHHDFNYFLGFRHNTNSNSNNNNNMKNNSSSSNG
ncbi:uncharacterized protein LOC124922708 [Impatiens glandulifera]|uniref:uncharacterized protein LOC124922708 n=1 Tax=Impatiens glandulifera TaxID=253017 RepID=UPI001FB15A87|nr:uncharacterized protein LOC124922708 [Impatiens glandulifera]